MAPLVFPKRKNAKRMSLLISAWVGTIISFLSMNVVEARIKGLSETQTPGRKDHF